MDQAGRKPVTCAGGIADVAQVESWEHLPAALVGVIEMGSPPMLVA